MDEARVMSAAAGRAEEEAQSVLSRARACDPEAFRAIFDRYAKPVLSFIFNLLGDRAGAEELSQETFVRAYRKLDARRPEAELSTWIFGIARNVVREAIKQEYRNRNRVRLVGERGNFEDPRVRPDESLLAGELAREIQKALAGLNADHRVVFVLRMFHKMKYEQIARVTGSSLGKVKTDLRRARLEVRRKLKAYLDEPSSEL